MDLITPLILPIYGQWTEYRFVLHAVLLFDSELMML